MQPEAQLINEEDKKLIKSLCSEDLLRAIRAVFFGFSTEEDKQLVHSAFQATRLKQIFHQRFAPSIERNTPIGQIQDVWLGAESMVFDKAPTTIQQAIAYKAQAIKMTRQALALLDDPNGKAPDISYDPERMVDELGIALLSRNMFVRHIESQLSYIKLIAAQPEAAPAEQERQKKGRSSK